MQQEHWVIKILIAALPVILAPILAWLLGRSGISKEAATIDYLNKRLDVLERMNRLHTQLTEAPIRPFLDAELEICRVFLRQPLTFVARAAEAEVATPQSRWAQFFLTQRAVSVRKRVYKGLFYFFFGTAVLMLLAGLATLSGDTPLELFPGMLFAFGFYLAIALLFRRGAR